MFLSLVRRIERDGVILREIEADWTGSLGTGQSDNLDEYVRNLRNGMTKEEAAKQTWTGRRAAELGYTEVIVPWRLRSYDGRFYEVSAVFSKPTDGSGEGE